MTDDPSPLPAAHEPGAPAAEARLAERFARGEPNAFDELAAAYQERISRLVYRLLGWSADADDVVQEVFLSALQHRRRFRGRSRLSTWLSAIALNKCRTHRRRRAIWLRLRPILRARARPAIEDASARSQADETAARVQSAVRSLPGKYREVVVLRYLEEMPVGEVAGVLGVSEGTVLVRLHRARRQLKGLLGDVV